VKRKVLYLVIFAVAAAGAASGTYLVNRKPVSASAPSQATGPSKEAGAIAADFKQVLAAYRKMIVLTQDEAGLSATGREDVNRVGQQLFHENQERIAKIDAALAALAGSQDPRRFEAIGGLLDYVESNDGLYDADRLAFRELMQSLLDHVAKDSSLPAIKLHKRVSEDLDALAEIERTYEKEIRAVFGRFESRAIVLKREKWDSYVAYLKTIYQRDQILKDYGVVLAYPARPEPPSADNDQAAQKEEDEIFGKGLPKKTIVLTVRTAATARKSRPSSSSTTRRPCSSASAATWARSMRTAPRS
jgi:hypothetical protein